MRRLRDDDDGSSAVEFVLVGTLLTLLTLAVLQLALAVYIRNVVHDACALAHSAQRTSSARRASGSRTTIC